MTDYIIIVATTVEELMDEVNRYISEGWKPQGGIAILKTSDNVAPERFFQAMVR